MRSREEPARAFRSEADRASLAGAVVLTRARRSSVIRGEPLAERYFTVLGALSTQSTNARIATDSAR